MADNKKPKKKITVVISSCAKCPRGCIDKEYYDNVYCLELRRYIPPTTRKPKEYTGNIPDDCPFPDTDMKEGVVVGDGK